MSGLTAFLILTGCSSGGSSSSPTTTVSVTVSPATVSLSGGATQAFTASVANDSQNAGVTWSIGSGGGSLSAATATSVTYSAPSTISTSSTVTLTATSKSDTTKTSAAAITLKPASNPASITSVAVACAPNSVETGQTSQCTATVTGTGSYSSAVSWSVSGIQGGNSSVGTISNAGLFTAPATVPSSNPVTVTATSTADSTKYASAPVTISAASSAALAITRLSESSGNPFDPLTITGTGFGDGSEAISVLFTPENGDPALVIPVSASTATSIQAMVPAFYNAASGAFSAETVDVQVMQFSATTTYLSNTIKGLSVNALPSVPSGVPAGAMTAELLSSVLNISASIQALAAANPSLANVSSALSQLNTDIYPLISAATTIANDPTQTVNLTTANGGTYTLNAQTLAQADQLAQGILAAVASQASIPAASSSAACPAASGNATFDSNLCSAQVYFQAVASQASVVTGSGRTRGAVKPRLELTPPDKAALVLYSNLILGGIAEICEPAGGAVIYSLVGAPVVTSYISSLAVNQETPTGTDIVQGVGLNFLDQAAFNKVPVLGTSVDMVKAYVALATYAPPEKGILLSSGAATLLPGGETFLDPNTNTPTTLLQVPSEPQGATFDSTSLVVSSASEFALNLTTLGNGSVNSFPTGGTFPSGTVVGLTAVPASGSTFAGWGGACSGTGGCSVTMNSAQSVSAMFTNATADTVAPASMSLGTIGGCAGGTLSATIFVAPLPGVTWSIVPQDGNGDVTVTISPLSGTGAGTVALTITAAPQTGGSCDNTYTNTYTEQVPVFFSDGNELISSATWMYVVLQ